MLAIAASTALFVALAALVLRWARDDLRDRGSLSTKAVSASWLLYVLHADTVASATWAGALQVDAPESFAVVLGGVVATAGFALFLTGTVTLARHGEFAWPRTKRLVTSGVYRVSRHPQNVGWGVLLLGFAIAGRSLAALGLVALFAVFVERYTRLEEVQLAVDFGEDFERYRRSTPALVAWPKDIRAPSSPPAQTR